MPESQENTLHIVPPVTDTHHNAALDSVLTRPFARIMDAAAQPLIDHIYQPLTDYNHTLGLVAANATLTAPRLAERKFGNYYINSFEKDRKVHAAVAVAGKLGLKVTDGIDGPVTRGTGTTSQFGAFFDAGVDMAGTYDDSRCIINRAGKRGDTLTVNIVKARVATDVAVIAVGALLDYGATMYAKKKGLELAPEDETKANSLAKVKFALSAVGNTALLLSEIVPETKTGKVLRRTGQALDIASTAAGVVSIYQYGQRAIRKIKKAQALDTRVTYSKAIGY